MNYQGLTNLSATQFKARWQTNWRATMPDGLPQYLLRGQNALYLTTAGIPSIISYFSRLPDNPVLIGQIYTTFRRAAQLCTGTWGYEVGHVDALAVLQHYGWRTPCIDFTGNPDVALTFALHLTPQTPVVFVLDRAKIPANIIVSEHDFLISPAYGGGLQSRWWRQDGFGIMNETWRQADTSRQFNLYEAAASAIETIAVYNDSTILSSSYYALLSKVNDPHPQRVQSVLDIFCREQFGSAMHSQVRSDIDAIHP